MVGRDLGMPEADSTRKRTVPVFGLSRVVGDYRMKFSRQTTLRSQATVTGVGVHSGLPVNLTLGPAPVDAGFIFVRSGLEGRDREVQATAESVIATEFATVLGDREGPLVSTAEHVLAALRGMGVDNATIEIDGPEVPIMDGSAAAFVTAIDQAGILTQSGSRRFLQILKLVQVVMGDSFGELRPYAAGFRAEIEIDFTNPVIGRQSYVLDLSPERFRREICRARTFGCMNDVARLWNSGFALGASFDNSVVFDETRLLNPEGLRNRPPFARSSRSRKWNGGRHDRPGLQPRRVLTSSLQVLTFVLETSLSTAARGLTPICHSNHD